MKSINCIAIDDNISALNIIEELIKDIDDFSLTKKFTNPIEAANFLRSNVDIDVIFLDVNMPDMTGIEFLKTYKPRQCIIFISKHPEYAVDSYDMENEHRINIVDFLPFPAKRDRFIRACNNAREKVIEKHNFIYLNDSHVKYKVAFDDIILIESDEVDPKYMNFYTRKPIKTDKLNQTFRISLSNLEDLLPPNKFMRVNKKCILNLDHVNQINGDEITVTDLRNKKVNLGEKFREKLLSYILRRTGN